MNDSRVALIGVALLVLCAGCGSSNSNGSGQAGADSVGGASSGGASNSTGGAPATGGAHTGGSHSGGTSSSTGGGSGAGGAPHVVAACDSLAATGTWENVTPQDLKDHPTYTGALVPLVNPKNTATVYLTTDSRGVFKTTDCGATWTKANTGRNASSLDSGRIWSAYLDPEEPDTLYALTGYGATGLWKTTNGGTDWDNALPNGSAVATTAGGFLERVALDPQDHRHIVINFHQNCSAPYTAVCFGESTDGGTTWSIVDHGPGNGWAEGSGLFILGGKTWIYGSAFGGISRTSDGGATWKNVTPSGAGGANFPGTLSAFQTPDGHYWAGTLQGVITSADGATWSLISNSGSKLTAVIGDGERLFATKQWPDGGPNVWVASYTTPMKWSELAMPGAPPNSAQSFYTLNYDPDHHLLYATMQSNGFWRVVTH